MRKVIGRWLLTAAGVLLGGLTAVVELVFVIGGGLWLLVTERPFIGSGGKGPVFARAHRLAAVERRRIVTFYGTELAPPRTGHAAFSYLTAHWALGLFGAGVLLFTGLPGLGSATFLVWGWFVTDVEHTGDVVFSGIGGLFLLFLCVQGTSGVAALDERLARRFFGPSEKELLEHRIGELAASRAGVVQAVHDERRRIERDIHDGVQQRMVALGMLLGRARRTADPEKASALLRQAHEESGQALTQLREVAWRIYPSALDDGGLADALGTLADRAPVPVDLVHEVPEPPPEPVQTVAYFVVAEAVTNAVKHADATRVAVRIAQRGSSLLVRVEDDGRGGADPAGAGLLGLSRRVAALDGRFDVASPAGGPTTVTAELPCA